MNDNFITVAEVSEYMKISKSKAYRVVKGLNDELKEKGFLVIAGRCPKKYFLERVGAI